MLPANVYKKNLIAAYRRSGPPQIPIRKNSGTSVNEEYVKQDQIERREYADQPRLKQQQARIKTSRPITNRLPGNQHTRDRE
jgi:hypothetical protein